MQFWKRLGAVSALVLTLGVGGSAQIRNSAAETCRIVSAAVSEVPISTVEQFRLVEAQLRKLGFVQVDSTGWRYTNLGDVVVLFAFPEQRSFFLQFLPASSNPMGDVSLAALINKASSVTFERGDSIELTMQPSRVPKEAHSLEVTEAVSFTLSGGRWWRTHRVIKWAS